MWMGITKSYLLSSPILQSLTALICTPAETLPRHEASWNKSLKVTRFFPNTLDKFRQEKWSNGEKNKTRHLAGVLREVPKSWQLMAIAQLLWKLGSRWKYLIENDWKCFQNNDQKAKGGIQTFFRMFFFSYQVWGDRECVISCSFVCTVWHGMHHLGDQ